MVTIGKSIGSFVILITALTAINSFGALKAQVDRNDLSLDESVSLKITSDSVRSVEPKFDAPDFEIMNQFESTQFSSVYTNGHFENKSEKTFTFILRPLKVGSLKIRNIRNDSTSEKASDIAVQVNNNTNAGRKSLTGDAPSLKGDAKNFFVKSEVSKSKAYKGEQLIVSYYLYRRTRANLRDVMQYPSFPGFIREDLEMPILAGSRLDYEAVSLGGIPFERALLARYAVYPIKEGKLKIDGLSIRADYIPKNEATDDMFEDPFFQFFSQVTPRSATSKSDPVNVDVLPLPEEGKTSAFTGGVGTFEISAQVDQAAIKQYAPLIYRISIQGKGNASLIEFPQVAWPKEFKFYESQGKSKNLGQGRTEKTFEVVIVPQEKGTLEIPPVEFEFFDPETRSYVRKKTTPVSIQVAEGDPQSAGQPIPKLLDDEVAPQNVTNQGWQGMKVKESAAGEPTLGLLGQPLWRWVAWVGLLVFFSFVGLVIYDQVRKRSQIQLEILKKKQDQDTFWVDLQREAQSLNLSQASPAQFSHIMEQMIDQVHSVLDARFKISSRALPRRDLANLLTENHKMPKDQWTKISSILEFSEMVRFTGGSAFVSGEDVRTKTNIILEEARRVCSELSVKNA